MSNKCKLASLLITSMFFLGGCASISEDIADKKNDIVQDGYLLDNYAGEFKDIKEVSLWNNGAYVYDAKIIVVNAKKESKEDEIHTIIFGYDGSPLASIRYKKDVFESNAPEIINQTKKYYSEISYPDIALGVKTFEKINKDNKNKHEIEFKKIKLLNSNESNFKSGDCKTGDLNITGNKNSSVDIFYNGYLLSRLDGDIVGSPSCDRSFSGLFVLNSKDDNQNIKTKKIISVEAHTASAIISEHKRKNAKYYFKSVVFYTGMLVFLPVTLPAFLIMTLS